MSEAPAAAIRRYLESQQSAMLEFVKKLVGIDSHATQPEGTNAVGDAVCGELESIGYTTERVRGKPLPADQRWLEELMIPDYDANKLGDHRVAHIRSSGRGRVLVLGDLDTAFTPSKKFEFHVRGDRALGPGIADMKGGLTVAVYALKALQATQLNNLAQIMCVLSSDEQAGSLTSRPIIEKAAHDADWV